MRRRLGRMRAFWAGFRTSIFWELFRRQRRWVLAFFGFAALSSLSTILQAGAEVGLIDSGFVQQDGHLPTLLRNYFVVSAFYVGVYFTWQMVMNRISWQVDFDLRMWLYTRLQSADVQRLDALSSGQVLTRSLTDIQMVEVAVRQLPILVAAIPGMTGRVLFLIAADPILGLFAAVALPLNFWVLSLFRHRMRALSWAELNERAEAAAAIDEPVRGIRVVQAFDRADEERSRVAAVALRVYRFALARARLLARYDILLKAAPVAIQALLLLVGGTLAARGEVTVGTFLLAFSIVNIAVLVASQLDDFAQIWQFMVAAQGRLTDVLSLGQAPTTVGEPLPPVGSGLRFQRVTVTYGDTPVMRDVDLDVAPGELVVLVGGPGSGKTTLASAAAGLVVPASGEITVDGIDVRLLDPPTARRAVLVVPETPFFFAATVRANLQLAQDERVADLTLADALHLAGADDVVSALAGGLDGEIGDRGLTLSGGQRQRLALARALIAPPRILVLDDALSAVNPALEVEIIRRIRAAHPSMGILCISRRQGPASIADRVRTLPDPVGGRPAPAREEVALAATGLGDEHRAFLAGLKLRDERPSLAEAEATADERPQLRTITRAFKGLIALALVSIAGYTATRLAPSFIIGDIADLVTGEGRDTGAIAARAAAIAMVGCLGGLLHYAFRVNASKFTQSVAYLLRRRMATRLTRLGTDYYDRVLPGDVAARVIYDIDNTVDFLARPGFQLTASVAQVVLALVGILVLSPSTFAVVGLAFASICTVSWIAVRLTNAAYDEVRRRVGLVTVKMEEDFAGRRDIRYFSAARQRTGQYAEVVWDVRNATRRALTIGQAYTASLQLLTFLMLGLVLFQAGNQVLGQAMAVGTAVTLSLLAQQTTQPMPVIGRYVSELQRTQVSFGRLGEPFGVPILPPEPASPVALGEVSGTIDFDGVAFAYPNTSRVVLHDLTLRVEAGATVAVVGYTGAGKSSLAKLLMRTYDPDRGEVRVDGVDLRMVGSSEFRRHVGVVPQDAFLFRGTVRSNIAYGRPDASTEEIEAAAMAVGAYEVLAALPNGLDHAVHEEGRNLTGAQCQLVALARAWLRRPAIMVLDEATSSLDAGVERRVLDAIRALSCTTVMVTHRESVVAAADHIVVVDEGVVVEEGPPDAVIGAGGAYDRLWAAAGGADVEGVVR